MQSTLHNMSARPPLTIDDIIGLGEQAEFAQEEKQKEHVWLPLQDAHRERLANVYLSNRDKIVATHDDWEEMKDLYQRTLQAASTMRRLAQRSSHLVQDARANRVCAAAPHEGDSEYQRKQQCESHHEYLEQVDERCNGFTSRRTCTSVKMDDDDDEPCRWIVGQNRKCRSARAQGLLWDKRYPDDNAPHDPQYASKERKTVVEESHPGCTYVDGKCFSLRGVDAGTPRLRYEEHGGPDHGELVELANRIDPLPSSSSSQMQPHRINEFLTKLFKVKARVRQNPAS